MLSEKLVGKHRSVLISYSYQMLAQQSYAGSQYQGTHPHTTAVTISGANAYINNRNCLHDVTHVVTFAFALYTARTVNCYSTASQIRVSSNFKVDRSRTW
jgi:hypothetical protein